MTQNIIPAGYRFTTVSFENDADNEKVVIIEGIPEERAKLIGELASIIKVRGTGLENNYEPSDKEFKKAHKILLPVFEKYSNVFTEEEMNDFREDVGMMQDFICENLLDYPAEDGYALRYMRSIKVEYIPQDIVIEDVTNKIVQ